ncbi:cutinase family protein [Nocardia jiangxiensis]|uniref:cutinase family protein n=1 Tax=Nocardia jiangxiensis TaxID=282685 RepID=UPI000594D1AD|nr:cutinase family protein [Nocardia jiangxiensis]
MTTTTRAAFTAAATVMTAWTLVTPAQAAVPITGCPALYVLAVQGTGQSAPGASPTSDTSVLGELLKPVVALGPNLVQRSYIGYDAGFGGAVPGGGAAPYATSANQAIRLIGDDAKQVAATCPSTKIAGVAYSQGAQAWSEVAQEIGDGRGPIPADRIAAVILYADPDRPAGAPVIAGRPGQTRPDAPPGTNGAAVSGVQIAGRPVGGAGIGNNGQGYGALTGRVAEICAPGDLACSAPDHAAILRFAARLVAQADLRNPIAALGSLNTLLTSALGAAWTTIVGNDFTLANGTIDYTPRKSLSQRFVDAADPRNPAPTLEQTNAANARWGQITATVAANLIVTLPKLVGQLAAAVGQIAGDNADLTNPAVWAHFADTVAAHTGYASNGQLASGIAWLIACAHDLAGSHP